MRVVGREKLKCLGERASVLVNYCYILEVISRLNDRNHDNLVACK